MLHVFTSKPRIISAFLSILCFAFRNFLLTSALRIQITISFLSFCLAIFASPRCTDKMSKLNSFDALFYFIRYIHTIIILPSFAQFLMPKDYFLDVIANVLVRMPVCINSHTITTEQFFDRWLFFVWIVTIALNERVYWVRVCVCVLRFFCVRVRVCVRMRVRVRMIKAKSAK